MTIAFFIISIGENMKIYLDLVFLLNFAMDFLLLWTVNMTLKRNAKGKRMLLGALLGTGTLLLLFLPLNKIELILIKCLISAGMCIITFQFQNISYTIQNMVYFYMTGTILGGFLYSLNIEFSYEQKGIIFIHHGLSVNFLFLIIISPIILYIYIRSQKKLKIQYAHYYQLIVTFKNNHQLILNAFLDTGNKLIDPITKKAIILVENAYLQKEMPQNLLYVPYKSLNHQGILKCIIPKKVTINGVSSNQYLIGISEEKFHIDGINCLLNAKCQEDLLC